MLEVINDFLSGKVLIVLMVGLGGYFTIRSRFVQFRYFLHMFSVFKDSLRSSAGELSSFQALMLSLAGRVEFFLGAQFATVWTEDVQHDDFSC